MSSNLRPAILRLAGASHWFKPDSGGQVERSVQDSRHRLWQPMPEFPDLLALNVWLERRCQELWHEIPHGASPGSVADVWAEEQAALMSLPPAFHGFVVHSNRNMAQELLIQRSAIMEQIAPHDPVEAPALLSRFMGSAMPVPKRCDDSRRIAIITPAPG